MARSGQSQALIFKAVVAGLWFFSLLTELDTARDFPDPYGLWTVTVLATLLLAFRLIRDRGRTKR